MKSSQPDWGGIKKYSDIWLDFGKWIKTKTFRHTLRAYMQIKNFQIFFVM